MHLMHISGKLTQPLQSESKKSEHWRINLLNSHLIQSGWLYLAVGIKAWSWDLEGHFVLCPLVQLLSNKIGFSHVQICFHNLLSQLPQAVGQHFFSGRMGLGRRDRKKSQGLWLKFPVQQLNTVTTLPVLFFMTESKTNGWGGNRELVGED